MRRLLFIFALLVFPKLTVSQTTTVTGNVTDSAGQVWSHGFIQASFVNPRNSTGPFTWSGGAFNPNVTIVAFMDGSGNYTLHLPDNTTIVPAGSQWRIIANSGTTADTTGQLTLIISGGTMSVNLVPNAIRVDAGTTHPVVAYTTAEVKAAYGQFFYKLLDNHYYVCTTSTSDACSVWVPLCEPGDGLCSGVSSVSVQHNGTLVGTQPIINLIDGANTTLTVVNNSGATRIDVTIASIGGGSGCTLPGINTGVLSEHPAGTCFDSLHWTWDDGTGKQNMQAGLSNIAGFSDSYVFGNSNSVSGLTTGFIAGDSNSTVSTDADVYITGISNGSGQPLNVNDCFIIGETNRFPGLGHPSTYGANVDDCGIFGINNALNFSNTGTLGGSPSDIWIVGSNNTLTESGLQSTSIASVHILGRQNTVTDVTNSVDFVVIAGDRNSVDGAQTTVEVLGWNNSFSNVSTGINTVAVGADNTLTNVATTTYALTLGNNTTLSGCDACYILGQNVHNSVTGSIAIGMNIAPELVIKSNQVTLKPLAFSSLPSCAAGTEGSMMPVNDSTTNTWGATVTGGSNLHILAYCDGTNWTVAAK